MIYILLSKSEVLLQKKIIEYIRINIKNNNFLYKIIFNNQHIIESDLENIDNEKDIVLWHPLVAYHNLEIIKNFSNSIVILDKATLYVQKISELNPISENLAINNGFYIIYINPDDKDITNDEYKLVVNEDIITTGSGHSIIILLRQVMPSITGILISRVTTSGFNSLIFLRASSPLFDVKTSNPFDFSNISFKYRLIKAESSTINNRIIWLLTFFCF